MQDAWALTASPVPQDGKTPLKLAVESGEKDVAKLLREAGAPEDAEEGKKLLAKDQEALVKAAAKGDETKVWRILAPRLSIPATFDRTLRTD